MLPDDAGAEALNPIDAALTRQPDRSGQELSAALRCLGAFRDGLVTAQRKGGGDEVRHRLAHVNAVISCVMAIRFPSGDVPWPELHKARDWLRDVLVQR